MYDNEFTKERKGFSQETNLNYKSINLVITARLII